MTRVSSPWQAGKMAARPQAATSSAKPVLLRADCESERGVGLTKTQCEQVFTDEMSFLLWQFGEPGFQPSRLYLQPRIDSAQLP
jgi:prolyl oligopeptidase